MIDSVKFAERKNAALLTFCSVWIGAIINALKLRSFHSAAVLVLGVCICMAVSTALWIGQQTRFVFLSTSPSAQAPTP
ncbi:hypothetical protein SS05631_c17120 [Sinorhizobium sp. CCBAU 05631]|nr:hypothetical protein SS05631_c17120 [Sinorhizobium sp. CCBAU 05631]AWM25120.1 hypothetical protein AOX55_00001866 [Sinorhizobium fredii CCBAU 25509]